MYKGQRSRNIFNPASLEPFKLSRSKIEQFIQCPRCFYLDRRLGIAQPSGPPFRLNTAIDTLLKKEFDIHRAHGTKHPLMKTYGIDAVPFPHEKIDEWRSNFKGVTYHDKKTNFIITGAVDDIWVDKKGSLIVVDYKATSKDDEVTIDAEWQQSYKRQMEIYQWLLRKNGFTVFSTGYFVYCNGNTDKEAFDGKLEFDIKIIPYTGSDIWIEKVIVAARECLVRDTLPLPGELCDFCRYRDAARAVER